MVTKREFLKTLALAAAGLGRAGAAFGEKEAALSRRPPKNWIWFPAWAGEFGKEDWKRIIGEVREAGIDAILVEVYDGKQAHWDSRHLPVKTDLLGMILPLAHNHGVEIHAWMWTMPCLIPEILKKHPDWYTVNAKGESAAVKPPYVDYYKFLDPARPEVREWIQKTVAEISDIPRLTGVHLDYVRHPDAILPKALWKKYNLVQDHVFPEFDYGYTKYARNDFKKKHGVDPLKLKDPTNDKDWMQYRWDAVTNLVNDYLVPAARTRGRLITAAVFPGPTIAKQIVRQDWGRWKLDAFLPMLYNGFYEAGPEWVKEQAAEAVATVSVPVYSGLYLEDAPAGGLAPLVNAAFAGGAAGVSLFSYADLALKPERWKEFVAAMKARA